jgi:peptidoglycan/LPS O-acetylase OafA/YrhL
MSWNIWVPLSRLSYCVYLIHFVVIYIIMGLSQGPLIYSNFSHAVSKLQSQFFRAILVYVLQLMWSQIEKFDFSKKFFF